MLAVGSFHVSAKELWGRATASAWFLLFLLKHWTDFISGSRADHLLVD
jgi:hypothetical protein